MGDELAATGPADEFGSACGITDPIVVLRHTHRGSVRYRSMDKNAGKSWLKRVPIVDAGREHRRAICSKLTTSESDGRVPLFLATGMFLKLHGWVRGPERG
jgi:hypothetical protein